MKKDILARLIENTPFQFGSRIGRTRAQILDQFHRDETDDPRQKLMIIDELLDELIAGWTSNPNSAPHAENIKMGMEHGFEDSTNVLDKVRQVELKKQRQIIMQELEGMKDGIKKQKLTTELANVEAEMAGEGEEEEVPEEEIVQSPPKKRGKSKAW